MSSTWSHAYDNGRQWRVTVIPRIFGISTLPFSLFARLPLSFSLSSSFSFYCYSELARCEFSMAGGDGTRRKRTETRIESQIGLRRTTTTFPKRNLYTLAREATPCLCARIDRRRNEIHAVQPRSLSHFAGIQFVTTKDDEPNTLPVTIGQITHILDLPETMMPMEC